MCLNFSPKYLRKNHLFRAQWRPCPLLRRELKEELGEKETKRLFEKKNTLGLQ